MSRIYSAAALITAIVLAGAMVTAQETSPKPTLPQTRMMGPMGGMMGQGGQMGEMGSMMQMMQMMEQCQQMMGRAPSPDQQSGK